MLSQFFLCSDWVSSPPLLSPRYLIDIGADVNRKSVKGNTALHDCAESGSLEIMRMLLSSGANMDVDAYGK